MKKNHLLTVCLCLFFSSSQSSILFAQAATQPAESKPATRPLHSKSMLEEALTLMEIYGKIRKVIGKDDRSELKVQLDRLNGTLDQILAFKATFTPKKLKRVEDQLNQVKSDITAMGDLNIRQIKNESSRLLASLMRLVTVLMEPAPGEDPNTF